MAFTRLPRDINFHGFGSEDGFGLRWHRLLFPIVGMPAVHLGPIVFGNPAPTVEGHTEPTAPVPIDESTLLPPDHDSSGLGATLIPTDGAPAPLGADAAGPADGPALFWHPPYFAVAPLVESPAAPAPAPDDTAPPAGFIPKSDALIWSGPAVMAFPPDAQDTSGGAAATYHGATGDLGAAFLPPDSGDIADLQHGLDLSFMFTPPPLPPPDMI
jgi:hypothetical protein